MEERIVMADPVGDPQGYQRELLALLGTDKPVEVLSGTPRAWRDRAAGLSDDRLTTRPQPTEWSVAELLGHVWDAEIAYSFRARLILAQDSPPLIGYDQDAWARLAKPPFADLLEAYVAIRTTNLALITQTPPELWDRLGIHEERGPTTFRLLNETLAGHDRAHLKQLDQTVTAINR